MLAFHSSLLKSKRSLTMMEIEESFGSNQCRCTGYRPILDAFKSFADDSPKQLLNNVPDIEVYQCVEEPFLFIYCLRLRHTTCFNLR